jgi:two-component sensor histidine kinase
VSGEPSQLPAPLVQPLALVLHELISNARQHGALAQGGRVSVGWTEQPGALTVNWQEDGGPDLDSPPKPGFGLRMLGGLVQKQLKGEVRTSWAKPGFSARISVPTATAATKRAATDARG